MERVGKGGGEKKKRHVRNHSHRTVKGVPDRPRPRTVTWTRKGSRSLRSSAKQPGRRRRVLSQHRGRRGTKSAKDSWVTVTRNGATDITWHNATSVTNNCTVRVRLELDELALTLILDGKRTTAILRTAFRIADLEHLVQGDCLLRWRPQLLYLVENEIHIMVTTRADTWAESVEVFAGLDYQ